MISRDYVVQIVRELLAGLVVQTRRGTTSQWAASTKPLRDGEQGWNKTTKQLYIGNGTSLYPAYDVVGGTGGEGGGLSEAAIQAMIDATVEGITIPAAGLNQSQVEALITSAIANIVFPPAGLTQTQIQTLIDTSIGNIDLPDDFVLPASVLQGVTVIDGNETRPTATIVVWVGGSVRPTNMQDQDVWLAAEPPDVTAPSVPAGLVSSGVSQTGFTVTWSASTDDVAVTGYEVQVDGVVVATPTTRSYTKSDAVENTDYSVRIRARDAAGNWSALSSALVVHTLSDTALLNFFTPAYEAEMKAQAGWAPGTHTDGSAGMELGTFFWSSTFPDGTPMDNFLIHGVRLYEPLGADNDYLQADVVARLYAREYVDDSINAAEFPAASEAIKTATHTAARTANTWTEILFDAPVEFSPAIAGIQTPNDDLALVTVSIGSGLYMSQPWAGLANFIAAHSNNGAETGAINSEGSDTIRIPAGSLRTAFRLGTGQNFQSGSNWYGVDVIYSVVE